MLAYIAKRLLATIPVMAVVAIFVFAMLRLTPGDPASIIAGAAATTQDVDAIRARLGLDRPLLAQFFVWIGNMATGDFGESFFFKKQVAELVADRIEPTLMLSLTTMVLSIAIAVPLGVIAAYRQGTWIDRIVMGFSVLGFSVPVFVIGYALIYVFAIELNWLPVQGYQRLRGRRGRLPACGSSCRASRSPSSTSRSSRASRAPACSRCWAKTTSGPRAPRGSRTTRC